MNEAAQEGFPTHGGATMVSMRSFAAAARRVLGGHAQEGTEVVDGLRGLAIALVVWYHFWLFSFLRPAPTLFGHQFNVEFIPNTGFLGVDLFFGLSGFCLFFPFVRRRLADPKAPILTPQRVFDFWWRRLVKIVPSYIIVLVITALVARPRIGGSDQMVYAIVNHLTFVNNSYIDQFGQDNSVFWSLAIEMQFYVLFPLIALLFLRSPIVTYGALTAIALGFRHWQVAAFSNVEPIARQLPAYLDDFAAGMFAAYVLTLLRTRAASLERWRPLFSLAAVLVAAGILYQLSGAAAAQVGPNGRELWDRDHRALLAISYASFLVTASLGMRWFRSLIGNPILIFASLISYNLYLWHTLIGIYLWRNRIPSPATADAHDDPVWRHTYFPLALALAIGVSAAITYFVERPLLRRKGEDLGFAFAFERRASFSQPADVHLPQ